MKQEQQLGSWSKWCDNCIHWNYEPATNSNLKYVGGYCKFYSCTCQTKVLNSERPTRFDRR